MKQRSTPTRTLRERPDLEQLKRQAKELRDAYAAGDAAALAEAAAHWRDDGAGFALHDAQFVLARSYGFDSWPKLKAYVDGVTVRRLAEAVRAGDLAGVRAMLKARPEIVNFDQAENDEHRPIHYAVFARHAEMVRLLMEHGADARSGIYPHRPATTAWRIAKDRGYDGIVAIIEQEEAKRPDAAMQPTNELIEAFENRDEDKLIAMLENGAAPRDIDAAARHGFGRIVRWLAEHGAEMTARAAVALGDADWLRGRARDGEELLTTAVKHDRPEILRLLLDEGLDPNERHRLEQLEETVWSAAQPLWTCANEGKIEMARMLLERGADPNVHVYASGPAMHPAFVRKDAAMLELLERHGGVVPPVTVGLERDVERARRMLAEEAAGKRLPDGILEGRNVSEDLLRGAADSGEPEIVRMALPGVDWERGDGRWYWILLQAVWSSKPEVLRLVAERCDVTMRHPRFGRTILHDVGALGGKEVAAASGVLAAVLLDHGARLDVRDDVLRSTPLGWACRWGRVEMVRVLLDRGADPVEADAEPWARPRAWAGKGGNPAVIEALAVRTAGRPEA